MRYTLLKNKKGEVTKVEEGVPYNGLEWTPFDTEIDGVPESQLDQQREDDLKTLADKFGISLSDFIETAAKAFGIEPCAACRMRQLVLYHISKLGLWRSAVLIAKSLSVGLSEKDIADLKAIGGDL